MYQLSTQSNSRAPNLLPPGGLACHLLRDASTLAQPSSLHIIEAEDQGTASSGLLLPGAGPMRGRTGGYPREACFMAWATWPAIFLALSYADAPLSGRSGGSPPGWSAARTEVKALLTLISMELRSSWLRMYAARLHSCCMTINGISVKKMAKTLGVENFNSLLILWSNRAIFLDIGCQRVQLIHSCIILSLCRHLSKEIVAISAIGSKA